jgi:hypothetical protein
MGRPPKIDTVSEGRRGGDMRKGATLAELARSYHVGKSTISRLDKVN